MRKGEQTGACYGRGYTRVSKFIAFQIGLLKPCSIYPKKAAKGFVYSSPTPVRQDFPSIGAAEKMLYFGGAFVSVSCSYVYRHSTEAPGFFVDWSSQREERHCHIPVFW
jgi:hypothetical protein